MGSVSPVVANLQDEQTALAALLALMTEEQQLLVAGEIDGLSTLTVEKASLINQLAILANQRHTALGAAGFAPEENGMQAWLTSSKDVDAAALWDAVLELTRNAKELNRVNGILINKHMSNNQGALNALRVPIKGGSSFYGPSGQTTTSGTSRRYVVG